MTILITLQLILNWIFPTWLWVFSGILFSIHVIKIGKTIRNHIKGELNNNNNTIIASQSVMLPIFLALALTFGTYSNGTSIIQEGQGWTILFIFIISAVVGSGMNSISIINTKEKKNRENEQNNQTISNEKSVGSNLLIKIDNNKGKVKKFKISLKTARIFNRLIPKKARLEMEKKGIDLKEIIKKTNDKTDVGVLLEVQNDDEHITISIV
tara:strand:- start:275 stop:907 length:633 start_codon:yes stop_codon:yes gene_type:complete